jgi:hypothetical protein
MSTPDFLTGGVYLLIINLLSTKILYYLELLICSLYRVFIVQYSITNRNSDVNGKHIDSMLESIMKNRIRGQTPMYEILHDKNDKNKKNEIKGKKKDLESGNYMFTYNGCIIFVTIKTLPSPIYRMSVLEENKDTRERTITLMVFRWNESNLIDFININNTCLKEQDESNELSLDKSLDNSLETDSLLEKGSSSSSKAVVAKKNKSIYLKILGAECTWQVGDWIDFCEIDRRSLNTVFLPEAVKDSICNDYENFTNKKTKDLYSKISLHYRRSYLLYGKPGGGKTSFIRAFASKYNLDIYEINDLNLKNINMIRIKFNQITPGSIIVMEDIDVLFPNRKQQEEQLADIEDVSKRMSVSNQLKDEKENMSKFFNLFDGITNNMNGCIVFFTTNYIKNLDPAITRPGRCDKQIEFTSLDTQCAKDMFYMFYPEANAEEADIIATKISEQDIMPCTFSEQLKQNINGSSTDMVTIVQKMYK